MYFKHFFVMYFINENNDLNDLFKSLEWIFLFNIYTVIYTYEQ